MKSMRNAAGALLLCAWAAAAAGPEQMSVQMQQTEVRKEPSALGKRIGSLSYTERVTVLQKKPGWCEVQSAGGLTGWVAATSLTPKKIVMKAGAETANTGATGSELALAGKGFNKDVEAKFKTDHQDIDFTWVDRMEQWKEDPQVLLDFLKTGGVAAKGGAQ